MKTTIQLISDAVSKGDFTTVQKFLQKEPDLINKAGAYWLNTAAKQKDLAAIQYFVECGCDINGVDFFERTSLRCASSAGSPTVAKWLLEKGATIVSEESKDNAASQLFNRTR